MFKAPFGIIGVAAAVLLTASFANISAHPAKAPAKPAKDPACITLKDEAKCRSPHRLLLGCCGHQFRDREAKAQGLLPAQAYNAEEKIDAV